MNNAQFNEIYQYIHLQILMRDIALIGFVQALFFSLLIILKKDKEQKDYFLFSFLLFIGAELLYRYLLLSGIDRQNKWLILFDIMYWGLFGPLILIYVLSVTGKVRRIKVVYLLHLTPMIFGLYSIKGFFTGDPGLTGSQAEFSRITIWSAYIWEFATPAYNLIALFLLVRHRWSVRNYFSDITGKNLTWLIMLISGHLICIFTAYTIWFLVGVLDISIKFRMAEIQPAIITAYVFFIGFFGYKQGSVFYQQAGYSETQVQSNSKYSKSGLTDYERNKIIAGIKDLMDREKPYIECDLNISELAGMLHTDTHKLSQVINESFNKNFYDFINTYRIEESKRMLRKPGARKLKIIAIAYDCGFSTKSAFYNAFRKNTGITPGEYLNKFNAHSSNTMLN